MSSSRRSTPDHYSIRLACGQAYPAFFDQEVGYRRAMHYPPYVALDPSVSR
jgi:primosomal protein N' (replication factor Y) (superfamily II helicase)